MRNSPFTLVVQLSRDMTKTRTGLNLGRVVLCVQLDAEHAVQLDHQVAIVTAKAPRRVAVATALGADLDAVLDTALDGGRDVRNRRGHGDGHGLVLQAQVVRGAVLRPLGRALDVDGHLGAGEAAGDGIALGWHGRRLQSEAGEEPREASEEHNCNGEARVKTRREDECVEPRLSLIESGIMVP